MYGWRFGRHGVVGEHRLTEFGNLISVNWVRQCYHVQDIGLLCIYLEGISAFATSFSILRTTTQMYDSDHLADVYIVATKAYMAATHVDGALANEIITGKAR